MTYPMNPEGTASSSSPSRAKVTLAAATPAPPWRVTPWNSWSERCRTRAAIPGSLHEDRIGHGRSIEFTPVNRPDVPSLLRSRGRASEFPRPFTSVPLVTFPVTKSTRGSPRCRVQSARRTRDSLASGRECTHVARLICRCHASGLERRCIVGSRCQVRN